MSANPDRLNEFLKKNEKPVPQRLQRSGGPALKLIEEGFLILNRDPQYLENASHPSQRPLENVDLNLTHGMYVHTKNGEVYLDLSRNWMTGLVDSTAHENALAQENYLLLLGLLAQEKATPTETASAIQALFVDRMITYFARGESKDDYRVLPVSAGTLAVADAIHTAKGIIAEKQNVEPQTLKGIAFDKGFHGRYDDAADATSPSPKVDFKQHGVVDHQSAPVMTYFDDGRIDYTKSDEAFEIWKKETERLLSQPQYAYAIIEYPIQAEGGARIMHPDCLEHLSSVCNKYGKVLIVDNVQMGGRSFSEKAGIVSPFTAEALDFADIVTFGKVFHTNGSVINNRKLREKGLNADYVATHASQYGGTHTASFADMLSGAMIMETFLESDWKRGLRVTRLFLENLWDFALNNPGLVLRPRGREDTAYLAWSYPDNPKRDDFLKNLREKEHMIMLGAGDDSVRLAPSDMSKEEMEYVLEAVERHSNSRRISV